MLMRLGSGSPLPAAPQRAFAASPVALDWSLSTTDRARLVLQRADQRHVEALVDAEKRHVQALVDAEKRHVQAQLQAQVNALQTVINAPLLNNSARLALADKIV